jgi:peptidyl-prolyl cis-trans isomerase D
MVKPFSDAVFSSTRTGLLPNVVETDFGYHIIDVTHLKTNKQFKVATIERTIISTDETRNKVFRKADYFAGTNTNIREFDSSAEADSLQVLEASNIGAEQTDIAGIGGARQIVRWLFTEANKNKVSDIFEIDDQYVVVVMTDEIEEGTSEIEDVKFQVERNVINEKKAEYIMSKLGDLTGSVDEIAVAFGEGANVYNHIGLTRNANSIPSVGAAPEAIGKIFTLAAGQTTGPVKTRSGVMIATIETITQAPEIADYSAYKNQLLSSIEGRTSYYISESVKEGANIKDERYKFY